ncbi:MAG: cbb3-type cytochrome oxidase assembly protein CcoS [Verrucomicrobiae bacterium]|nr:cbb3-type cytochrome oxidase assembly protein CcoS [Verrucomicrobiae bacterium]
MTFTLVALFIVVVAFTAIAIGAFGWAAKTGQFHGLEAGARSIFDTDEPIGRPTDHFPERGRKSKASV